MPSLPPHLPVGTIPPLHRNHSGKSTSELTVKFKLLFSGLILFEFLWTTDTTTNPLLHQSTSPFPPNSTLLCFPETRYSLSVSFGYFSVSAPFNVSKTQVRSFTSCAHSLDDLMQPSSVNHAFHSGELHVSTPA